MVVYLSLLPNGGVPHGVGGPLPCTTVGGPLPCTTVVVLLPSWVVYLLLSWVVYLLLSWWGEVHPCCPGCVSLLSWVVYPCYIPPVVPLMPYSRPYTPHPVQPWVHLVPTRPVINMD